MRINIQDLFHGTPWLIERSWIGKIQAIIDGAGDIPEALAARLARQLDRDSPVEVRGDVAIIGIDGPIFPKANMLEMCSGAVSLEIVSAVLTEALEDPRINAVILEVDSPGGVAFGPSAFADLIRARESTKPVVAFVAGLGASAAYWIAAAADRVVMDRGALVGSIGAVQGVEVQEAPDQQGRRRIEVVSSNAANKRPDVSDPEGLAEIRRVLDGIEARFIADIGQFRGVSRDTVIKDFGGGGLIDSEDALRVGAVDQVMSFEELLASLAGGGQQPTPQEVPLSKATIAPALLSGALAALAAGNPFFYRVEEDGTPVAVDKDQAQAEGVITVKPGEVGMIENVGPPGVLLGGQVVVQDSEIASAAATAERTRILGIEAACAGVTGHKALIAECKADPKCSPEQAAAKVLTALGDKPGQVLAGLRQEEVEADTPEARPGPSDGGPGVFADPKAAAAQINKLRADAAAEGMTLSYVEAAKQLRDQAAA